MTNTLNNNCSQGESHSVEQGGVPTKSQVENWKQNVPHWAHTEQKLHFPWAYRTFNDLNNDICTPH